MCEVAERLTNIGLAEGLEKGLAKGRAEGRVEGRAEGRIEDIERMLRSGKAPEQIADFCGYDLEEVKKVEQSMFAEV